MNETNPSQIDLPNGEQVRAAREAAGLSLKQASEIFGYPLVRSWQKKEESGNSHRQLSLGEWNFLLLLAGQHPAYTLKKK